MSVNDCDVDPGIYPDMPMDEYHSYDAISSTFIRKCDPTISHGLAYLDREDDGPSKTQRIGTATHAAVLEPDEFQHNYIDSEPPVDTGDMYYRHRDTARLLAEGRDVETVAEEIGVKPETVKKYTEKEEVQKLRVHYLHHPPEESPQLSDDELERSRKARDAVLEHPKAAAILADGEAEVSHFWEDETGLMCRCRPDFETSAGDLVDLKTTDGASRRNVEKHIGRHGYHIQAAYYEYGVSVTRGKWSQFYFLIFVETTPPFGCTVYEVGNDSLQRGRRTYRDRLDRLAKYYRGELETVGYPTEITTIEAPNWA